MREKQYDWQKLCEAVAELAFSACGIAERVVDGKNICIAFHHDQLYGFSARCPHAGGLMSSGRLDGLGNIICPIHQYKFSIQNGRNTSGEGYFLKTYPVEMREDGIYVGIERP